MSAPRMAWIERNPDGVPTAISAHQLPRQRGRTYEQMEWNAAHDLVRAAWFGTAPDATEGQQP